VTRSPDPDALATASDAAHYRDQRLDRDASREPRQPAPPLTADDYAERTALAVPLSDDDADCFDCGLVHRRCDLTDVTRNFLGEWRRSLLCRDCLEEDRAIKARYERDVLREGKGDAARDARKDGGS